ncbi:MAG: lysophospholipid acyltransferase family protein [Thermodesulfobacteriota bacterium]
MALNIKVKLNRPISFPKGQSYLVISNHLSYLDIFILFTHVPAVFIASIDMVQNDIVLGKATEYSGGMFVDRDDRTKIREELNKISETFDMGLNVVLFPEGTTSNGDQVLPFKTSFFAITEKRDLNIIPTCIKYVSIDGKSVDEENRDLVYFYGGMKFFKHFFGFLSVNTLEIELSFLDTISSGEIASRKDLASKVYDAINSEYLK